MFERGSRYEQVGDAVHVDADGREIPYKLLRVLPRAGEPGTEVHVVTLGDRLDLIADRLYGDPDQLWRIADANQATRPDRLTDRAGARLRLPRVEGGP
jgi:nucleoid-associated protein YgaU